MLNKGLLLFSALLLSSARAQDAAKVDVNSAAAAEAAAKADLKSEETPVVDGKSADLEGSIADTNVQRVFENKSVLAPELGFEDLFLTKGSSAVLDTGTLGYPRDELEFIVTDTNIIEGGRRDASGGERITVGKSEGSTQLLFYSRVPIGKGQYRRGKLLKVYRVTVTNQDLLGLLQELRKLIGDVEGIDLRVVGQQVVIDGKILVPKDMRRVLAVVSDFKKKRMPILNLAEISPLALKMLGEKMEEEIAGGKDRQRDIRVKTVNGRFFLEGAVDKRVDREAAVKICQAYIAENYAMSPGEGGGGTLLEPQFNPQELGQCVLQVRIRAGQPKEPDPIISVRVDFVTMNRSYLKTFGFRWAPGVALDGNVTYSTDAGKLLTNFVGTIGNLFPILDTAANHGYARVLKSATLLVRDGSVAGQAAPPPATISETLTINVPFQTTTGSATAQQPPPPVVVETGIGIRAQSVAGSDKINMDVQAQQTELSEIAQQSGALPNTLKNRIETSLVVANGESAALGGLIVERRSVGFVRDPARANGTQFSLFEVGRDQSFKDDKQQFIIFVTPEKLRNPSQGTETLKRKFRLRK